MKKYLYLNLIILSSLFSCQEEVRLELKNMEKIPVIEAIWTDRSSVNKVSVTYSRDFYDTLSNEILSEAEVSITNIQSGNRVEFLFVDHLGHFLPLNNQVAEIGSRYRLEVKFDGQVYFSEGEMLEPPVLDSVTYAFSEERFFRDEGYYVTVYGKIPFDRDNYYRVKIIRNDTLLNRRSDYLLFDDTFGTSILDNGFELGGFAFEKNDKVKLELYRLNQAPYNYLNQLVNLLFNDGGLFSPPPQNPTSNIYVENGNGRVGGYFVTSPVLSETIKIIDEEM
ncbi:MAG TPA: DUF4249 family protein [Lunatimonas sp.]|nr:DUF4249 family protein [Lunatimonas sp.]